MPTAPAAAAASAGYSGPHRAGSWPLDEGTGTVARDPVRDKDLTLKQGAAWSAGKTGVGLQFNGTGAHAESAGPVLDTSGNFTVAAWVKLDRLNGFATAVSQDGPHHVTFFLQNTGDKQLLVQHGGGRALSTFTPEVGRWYHLVGVRDATAGDTRSTSTA